MQLLLLNAEGVARVDGQDRIEFLVQTRNAVVSPMLQVSGCASNAPHTKVSDAYKAVRLMLQYYRPG